MLCLYLINTYTSTVTTTTTTTTTTTNTTNTTVNRLPPLVNSTLTLTNCLH